MGVYHLMGLGLTPGAVTAPLSYLANRYQRWNFEDQAFFARSGEASHREQGQKVGDVQSIILFTTREVIQGVAENKKAFLSSKYINNAPGTAKGSLQEGDVMKKLLPALLKSHCEIIFGGRQSISLYWCEIDRRNIQLTYQRVVQIITALSSVGGQGKEIWANLTGGNNVINFALQLAATLSGDVARLYYIQAQDRAAEQCINFATEKNYWVEMPVIPLELSSLNLSVLDLAEQSPGISEQDLYSRLCGSYWALIPSAEVFREITLKPLWKQGLIMENADGYRIGPQWELIQPYQESLKQTKAKMQQTDITLEKLAQQASWIELQEIPCVT